MIDEIRFQEDSFNYYLELLLRLEVINGKGSGITKLVIDKGYEFLSSKQKFVFDTYVIKKHSVEECSYCKTDLSWYEMIEATENGGRCCYCAHMEEKLMSE